MCEGRVTEPQYFSELANHHHSLVSIKKAAGVPLSVLKKARELKYHPEEDFGQNDQIWAVFDRDDHPEVARAINEAHDSGIFVAYSNPCFELWLVLHYRDHDAPVTRSEIQRTLRALLPGYNPRESKAVTFSEVCDTVERAEIRAEAMERRRARERNVRGNPSSSVYKLTREIRKNGR